VFCSCCHLAVMYAECLGRISHIGSSRSPSGHLHPSQRSKSRLLMQMFVDGNVSSGIWYGEMELEVASAAVSSKRRLRGSMMKGSDATPGWFGVLRLGVKT
jgi:hypothetical protein